MPALSDVFTVEEIARAAGVPRDAVDAAIKAGTIRPLPGTGAAFFEASEAIRAGIEVRRALGEGISPVRDADADIFSTTDRASFATRRKGLSSFASSLVHGVFVVSMLSLTSGTPESAPAEGLEPRLVFLVRPGPGGGGGGGGLQNPLPPRKAETPSRFKRPRPAVDASVNKTLVKSRPVEVRPPTPAPIPAPTPVVQDPVPSRRLVAPVAPATNAAQRDGALQARNNTPSLGSGTNGGTGTGRGTGDGEGLGSGIGPGAGGGIGGGPYRAGSGVEPPRLLREVKARYTDEARRRGTTGNVILEIVINRDGTVSDVSVRRGLGGGLDERAIEAVRQWKFAPARRLGEPVDVIVEVAVEFMLR
jgi:periplasmic protein TonB